MPKATTMFPCDIKGMTSTPECRSWRAMLHRCYNPNNNRFSRYGARGITVDSNWFSFANFLRDMGLKPDPTYTLNRKDNDLPYSKNNCNWATVDEQMSNTSRNVYVVFCGERKHLRQWARDYHIDYKLLHRRIKEGWNFSDALTLKPFKGCNDRRQCARI